MTNYESLILDILGGNTPKHKITSLRFPFSSKESILKIRKEKTCFFCKKKYKNSAYFGVVMTNKGSKICCDDCCELFKKCEV